LVDPTPSVAVTTPTLTPTLAPHKPAHRATATRPRPTDTLALRVTGSQSYIQITSRSGHLLIRRILHHGQHLAYRRHGLDVVIGNAGAVRLSVGGHRAHLAGRPGQVRRLHVH
jgi:cytoskeleton protein RodZ